MAEVKLKDIPFDERYIKLIVYDVNEPNTIVANLRCLFNFIGNVEGEFRPEYSIGTASRAILKRARRIAGNRKYIISKRQVLSLLKAETNIEINNTVIIKIPYASEYIFKAIFDIFNEYRNRNVIIPDEFINLYGSVRRDIFYNEQSNQYRYDYENNLLADREELTELRRRLLNDLCSEICALGREF